MCRSKLFRYEEENWYCCSSITVHSTIEKIEKKKETFDLYMYKFLSIVMDNCTITYYKVLYGNDKEIMDTFINFNMIVSHI